MNYTFHTRIHIDGKQLIFKLNLPKNHRKLYIDHCNNIASLATQNANNDHIIIINNNDQLVLLNSSFYNNGYEICLQIANYNNGNSHCFLYPKNENGNKLLLKNVGLNEDINMKDYKTPLNEVLFHITKI